METTSDESARRNAGISPIPSGDRYWQNWDRGNSAQRIDEYWLAHEDDWREALAADMRQALAGEIIPVSLFEVGCGSGLIFAKLRQHGIVTAESYLGGDVSKKMLEIARKRFPELRLIDVDIFDIDHGDRCHDNVACIHVLQHLPDYGQAVAALMRIARRKLYIATWFDNAADDKRKLDESTRDRLGQPFFNNIYSMPRFAGWLFATWGGRIEELRVHHFGGQNYSVCITLKPGS